MNLVYAVLASAVWLFVSGALVFALWLPRWFDTHFGAILRDKKSLPLWAVALEKVLQSIALVLSILWTTQPLLVLAALPLLYVTATYLLTTYANYRVKGGPVIIVALLDGLRMLVALGLAGWILARAVW